MRGVEAGKRREKEEVRTQTEVGAQAEARKEGTEVETKLIKMLWLLLLLVEHCFQFCGFPAF